MKLSGSGFSKEQVEFIKNNFDKYSYSELAEKFNEKFNENRTEASLNSKARRLGLRKNPDQIRYTKEQEDWLRENASKYWRKDLVKEFNNKFGTQLTYEALNEKCFRMRARGKTLNDWHKENDSWQKGLHGEEYKAHFTEESYKRLIDNINKVRPQNKPHQIIQRKDHGIYKPYIVLDEEDKKTHKNVAGIIPLARYVYEQKIGRKLKSNEYIFHLDGDVNNCDIDNLQLVNFNVACMLFSRGWSNIPNKHVMRVAIKECEFEQTIRKVSKERGYDE